MATKNENEKRESEGIIFIGLSILAGYFLFKSWDGPIKKRFDFWSKGLFNKIWQ